MLNPDCDLPDPWRWLILDSFAPAQSSLNAHHHPRASTLSRREQGRYDISPFLPSKIWPRTFHIPSFITYGLGDLLTTRITRIGKLVVPARLENKWVGCKIILRRIESRFSRQDCGYTESVCELPMLEGCHDFEGEIDLIAALRPVDT